jgi:hypothetical protein
MHWSREVGIWLLLPRCYQSTPYQDDPGAAQTTLIADFRRAWIVLSRVG